MKTPLLALAVVTASVLFLGGCGGTETGSSTTVMIDLLPDQIGDRVRSEQTDSYDRETIFDYINGAGEVYRSYEFSDVVVARYTGAAGADLVIEMFDMGNPADAYGVFSYAREREDPGIGGSYEHKGRVLCFWKDRYYVCVTLDGSPSESDSTQVLEAARVVASGLSGVTDLPTLVTKLPADGLIPFSERFFHTHQSLNYHYYLARENILELNEETDVVLARYEPGSTYLMVASYENQESASRALNSFRGGYAPDSADSETVETENGGWVSSRQADSYVVVVLDAPSEAAAGALLQAAVEKITLPTS